MIDFSPLLAKRYMLARYYPFPSDVTLIEPLGPLTLNEDGTTSGYDHPNERFWRPHGEGIVFVRSPKECVPTSYFYDRDGDGIYVGLFNHDDDRPHLVCLLPDVPIAPSKELAYVIASCRNYYKTTVPQLVPQLLGQGIPSTAIKVVVSGSDRLATEEREGIAFCFTPHRAFEFTALFEAPLQWRFDYCMLLHDTSRLRSDFRERVQSVNGSMHFDMYPASVQGRCNIGLYSKDYLLRIHSWMGTLDKIPKCTAITTECSGDMLLRAKRICAMGGRHQDGPVKDYFGTGTSRFIRHFKAAGLDKMLSCDPNKLLP